jgi:hypothetical protein
MVVNLQQFAVYMICSGIFFYRITYAVIECNASRSHYYTDVMHGYVVHIRLIVGLADGFRE